MTFANSDSPLLLEWKNVSFAIGDKIVLQNLSITVPFGDHVAILGPNGSGKSSFIKAINREYYPVFQKEGTIYKTWGMERWDVFSLRSYFGIVSNDLQYAFTQNITGREVILSGFFSSIGLFFHMVTPTMQKRSDEICSFLGIHHLMDRLFNEMSSGEARRFLIGRALVNDPKVLILDEPYSSLDLSALHVMRQTLRKIAQKTMVILVTHSLSDIIPEIERIIMIRNGAIFQDGEKERLLTDKYISDLFNVPVSVQIQDGYYYTMGY